MSTIQAQVKLSSQIPYQALSLPSGVVCWSYSPLRPGGRIYCLWSTVVKGFFTIHEFGPFCMCICVVYSHVASKPRRQQTLRYTTIRRDALQPNINNQPGSCQALLWQKLVNHVRTESFTFKVNKSQTKSKAKSWEGGFWKRVWPLPDVFSIFQHTDSRFPDTDVRIYWSSTFFHGGAVEAVLSLSAWLDWNENKQTDTGVGFRFGLRAAQILSRRSRLAGESHIS